MREFRDPIHGFIKVSEWERQIIDSPFFQRLRRIRQLAWTDMVYPGASHNRFEHSLGVMHIASRIFDVLTEKNREFLWATLSFSDAGLDRERVILRLACLLHDIGHSPFSHAGEGVMPSNQSTGKPYKHEHYSAAIVRTVMRDVIEQHPDNENYHITAEEIAGFIEGSVPQFGRGRVLLWRDLLSSQLDADRADYLLRDSYYCGVKYGNYDLDRLIATMTVGLHPDTGSPMLAVGNDGMHVAEALIIARYQMFTQVYFQHTRRAYDHHVSQLLKEVLVAEEPNGSGQFPEPTSSDNLKKYLSWDDWRVYGFLVADSSENCLILKNRRHYRPVYQTKEVPSAQEIEAITAISTELDRCGIAGFQDNAQGSWYKLDKNEDIYICTDAERRTCEPLSSLSSIVKGLAPVSQQRIYVKEDQRQQAMDVVRRVEEGSK